MIGGAVLLAALCGLVVYGFVLYNSIHRYTFEPGRPVSVRAHWIKGLGTVLVTDKGYLLYMFPPDHRRDVSCTGSCADSWPPVHEPAGTRPVAGPGVRAGLLDTVADPEGGTVVTYDGWPLYVFAGDLDPYDTSGQAIDESGGYWYAMRPSGRLVIPRGLPRPPEVR